MVKRLRLGDIRVTRITGAVEGAHAVPVERVVRQSWVWVARDVCPYRIDLHKVSASIPRATLDQKTGFVS